GQGDTARSGCRARDRPRNRRVRCGGGGAPLRRRRGGPARARGVRPGRVQQSGGVVTARVGFAGIGIMGEPMAQRLLAADTPLTVWSRRPEACAGLVERGAELAADPDALFAACDT